MVRKSPQAKATAAPVVEYEIDLDPGADGVGMDVDTGTGGVAKQRKGRGFKQSRASKNLEEREGVAEGFDRVEASHGKAQKSVEGWIVLVTNVHEELTEEDLLEVFAEFGPVKNLHLNLDRRTGYVKGYALVEYREHEQAKTAIKEMNGHELQGKILSCDFAFVRGPGGSSSTQTFKSRK